MTAKSDQMKGRVKQAAGDLTDDERLKREGKWDEMAGKAKEATERVKDQADDLIDKAREKIDRDN